MRIKRLGGAFAPRCNGSVPEWEVLQCIDWEAHLNAHLVVDFAILHLVRVAKLDERLWPEEVVTKAC